MGEPSHYMVFSQLVEIAIAYSSLHLLPAPCSFSLSPKPFSYIPWGGGHCSGSERRGAPVCLEGFSPPPPRVSFCCKAPWHPCMGWVLGSSDCSYNWLAARGRLFKSACSTRARSLFGNFCRGVKRASKELQSCLSFFSFFVPFRYPLLGLHPSPDFTQNLRVSKRWWQSRRQEVLGSRLGEV